MPIIEGLLAGAATIIFLGPVFFTLLQVTLEFGKRAGISISVGILVSDIVIVALLYYSTYDFASNLLVQQWLAIAGSVLLTGLGLKYLIKPSGAQAVQITPSLANLSSAFIKGFLVNFVNPFVFFVWFSFLTYAQNSYEITGDVELFLCCVLLGIFIMDLVKVFLAAKLQVLLRPLFLKRIFRIIGAVLILFGLRLVYFAVTHR